MEVRRPALLTVAPDLRKKAIDHLIEQSSPNSDFFLLLTLSVLIVVPGLLINNAAVIIGGMVVAPILSPILSLALGVVLSDFKLIVRSIRTITISLCLILALSLLMTFFYGNNSLNSEIISRGHASLSYLIIAIASGIAASFALVRKSVSQTLPGIAVSVSLLPPICVTGIAIALGNMKLATGSLAQFGINIIGIILASLILFSLFGFFPDRREADKKMKETAKDELA